MDNEGDSLMIDSATTFSMSSLELVGIISIEHLPPHMLYPASRSPLSGGRTLHEIAEVLRGLRYQPKLVFIVEIIPIRPHVALHTVVTPIVLCSLGRFRPIEVLQVPPNSSIGLVTDSRGQQKAS